MADRKLPELSTRIRLDTGDLDRAEGRFRRFLQNVERGEGFGRYEGQLERLAAKADQFGDRATRNLTLPIVAAGAVSTKLALDFERTFAQMQSLAGVAASEVEGLREEVLNLAGETARAPQELAAALYFIRSSGLEGSAALNALEVSAKASALGLGETQVVADAVTSAVNAYGEANLTAARAADILTAAVENGKGEAAAMAPQLGQLLPLAVQLGIGFDQVAGAVSFFTLKGLPASQAATQLRGVLLKLIGPSEQGREVLEQYGLSLEQLQNVAAQKGLLAALQLLEKALGGNQQQLRKFFDDSEGFLGVLDLLAQGGVPAAESIDKVTDSLGNVEQKFAELSETDQMALQRALVDLQRIGIDVGAKLIPVLADLGEEVSRIISVFDRLPDPVQTSLLAMVALAAVVGPAAKGISLAATGIGGLLKVARSASLDSFRLGLMGVGGAGADASAKLGNMIRTLGPAGLGTAAAGIGLLAAAFFDMQTDAARAEANVKDLLGALEAGQTPAEAIGEKLQLTFSGEDGGFQGLTGTAERLREYLDRAGIGIAEVRDALAGTDEEWQAFLESLETRLGPIGLEFVGTNLERFRGQAERTIDLFERKKDDAEALGLGLDEVGEAADGTVDPLRRAGTQAELLGEQMTDAADDARSLFDLGRRLDDANTSVTQAERDLAEARREASTTGREYLRAQQAITDAERAVQEAQGESAEAQANLTAAREEARERLEDLRNAARSAAADELSAAAALERARSDALTARTALDRQEAQARIAQAEAALANAQDQKGDTGQELADAERRGIDRSPEVVAAQERITEAREREREAQTRLAEATEEAAEVRRRAAERVRDASDRLTQAQLDQIDAVVDLTEATGGTADAQQVLLGALTDLEAKLAPDSPLRQRIRDYRDDLREIAQLAALGPVYSTGGTGVPGFRYPDQFPTGPPSAPRSLTNPGAIPAPAGGNRILAPAASSPGMLAINVQIDVAGQPDAATLAAMKDVAASTMEKVIREAGVGRL